MNTSLKNTQSSLNDVNRLLKFSPDNVELLEQKQKYLNQQIDATKEKLKREQEALEQLGRLDSTDEVVEQQERLQREVIATDSKLSKLRKELSDTEQQLSGLGNESKDTGDAIDKLTKTISDQESELSRMKRSYSNMVAEQKGATDEAQDLAQQIDRLSSELADNRNSLKRAADAADELDNSLEDAADSGGKMEVSLGSLGDILGGNAIVAGISNIVGGIKDLVESSMEYRRIMASLETSSQLAGYSAQQTAESYDTLIGVLGDTQTAATTTANLQALNLEQSELNTLIDGTIGAWAKFGDSIPIDSLAESITETARVGEVTGTLADVLNWTAGEEEAFNAELATTKDVSQRANKIIQKLANYGLTDLGEQWQENNEGMVEYNQASDDLQSALADLGETAAPVLTELVEGLSDLLEVINDLSPIINELFGSTHLVSGAFEDLADSMDIDLDDLSDRFNALTEEQQKYVTQVILMEGANKTYQERLTLLNNEVNAYTESNEAQTAALAAAQQQQEVTNITMSDSALHMDELSHLAQTRTERERMLAETNKLLSESDIKVAEAAANATTIEQARIIATEERNRVAGLSIQTAGQELEAYNNLSVSQQQLAVDVTNAVLTMESNVQSALESQMNMFEQFDYGVQLSTGDLLDNMRSQVAGVEEWEQNIATLSNRAINENLLQHLMEMGPEGAGYVQTFVNMSDDELKEASDLWAQSLDIKGMTNEWGQQLLETGAESITSSMEGITGLLEDSGADTVMGLVRGMEAAAGNLTTQAEATGEDLLNTINSTLDTHSPSGKTKQTGKDVDDGLILGIRENQTAVQSAADHLAYLIESEVRNGLNRSIFYSAGLNVGYGLADGIYGGRSAAVNAAISVANAAARAARNALQIHSPSKVFEEIGEYTTEGFAQGIENSAVMAELERNMNAMFARAQSLTIASQNYAPITDAIRNIPSGNTDIQIVVNAAEGQDANEIANAVMYKIQHAVNQKKAVWG